MRRSQRLSGGLQFRLLYRDGVKVDAESFRVIYRRNCLSHSRFAAVVNRKFGKAVQRSQAKRTARNLFDRFQKKISPACDVLIFPKQAMLTRPQAVLVSEFERVLETSKLFKGQ